MLFNNCPAKRVFNIRFDEVVMSHLTATATADSRAAAIKQVIAGLSDKQLEVLRSIELTEETVIPQ